jgi:hypothetical protein
MKTDIHLEESSMDQDKKLDLILEKIEVLKATADKTKLHELAIEHWGLTKEDIILIEFAKRLMDDDRRDGKGKVLQLVSEFYSEVITEENKLFTYKFKN